MSQKPEARFKDSIHRLLPQWVYRQSMFTPYSNGTPDHYYEAAGSHLWVEYKWLAKLPGKPIDPVKLLTAQQHAWAVRAMRHEQPWALIVGIGTGREARGIVFPYLNEFSDHTNPLMTKEEIATWICRYVEGPTHQ